MDAVRLAGTRPSRVSYDDRDAAQPRLRHRDRHDVERLDVELTSSMVDQGRPAHPRVTGPLPGWISDRDVDGMPVTTGDADGIGQQAAVLGREPPNRRRRQPLLAAAAGCQRNTRADASVRQPAEVGVRVVELADVVRTVGAPAPEHRRSVPGRSGDELDLVGHQEAREQADPELTQEVGSREPQVVPLRRPTDGRQELLDLGDAQPNAGVRDVQAAVGRDISRRDEYVGRCRRVDQPPSCDRIHGVCNSSRT
jgi:hypothetical protein